MNYNIIENDIYIKPLLEFLHSKNSEVNIDLIKKAAYFAKKYHGSQTRKSGEPYYSHPVAVALLLAENTYSNIAFYFTTDLIIAALLHDTLEDTELTFENLELEFNITIARHVQDLTRVKKSGKKITAGESVKQLYLDKKTGSLIVKFFDRIHNMQTISAKSPESIKKIVEETLRDFMPLIITLEITEMFNKLIELCYVSLNIDVINLTYKNFTNFKDNFQPLFPTLKNVISPMQNQ